MDGIPVPGAEQEVDLDPEVEAVVPQHILPLGVPNVTTEAILDLSLNLNPDQNLNLGQDLDLEAKNSKNNDKSSQHFAGILTSILLNFLLLFFLRCT